MAIMGFRLAGRSNAVSKLHGEVSRAIFSELWPGAPAGGGRRSARSRTVSTRRPGSGPRWPRCSIAVFPPGWAETGGRAVGRIDEVPDAELWRARERARERLVYFVRERVREQLLARGHDEAEVAWTDEVFDPGVLTIGFARRFAQYKRGTLLLSDVERLKRLLLSGDRPIQIVIAGKAHPLDDGGKEMIRSPRAFRRRPRGAPPLRVHRGLRHGGRPRPVPGLRRVAQQPAPSARGVRDERHEGRAERCRSTARSSMAGGTSATTARTDGRSERVETYLDLELIRIGSRRVRSTTCSSERSFRASTTAPRVRSRGGGSNA